MSKKWILSAALLCLLSALTGFSLGFRSAPLEAAAETLPETLVTEPETVPETIPESEPEPDTAEKSPGAWIPWLLGILAVVLAIGIWQMLSYKPQHAKKRKK